MKLNFNVTDRTQPDPFIFEDGEDLYLYVTGDMGVDVYHSKDLFGEWRYCGIATQFRGAKVFWAPSVIKIGALYYMYVSCIKDHNFEFMHVATSSSPTGPFTNEKQLYDHFSIDSHVVKTEAGLFLWYAQNRTDCEKPGTRIFIDRLIDPFTPQNEPKEILTPDFEEEKFTPSCKDGKKWYTLEGPFWFSEGEWQYLMYSAGCYQDDTYHVGYATAKSSDPNLESVHFEKVTQNGCFHPLIIKNEYEEGTGHNSVIRYRGEYYAIYHGRDCVEGTPEDDERRTARICRMTVADGKIEIERD